jgi:hypothetical protein
MITPRVIRVLVLSCGLLALPALLCPAAGGGECLTHGKGRFVMHLPRDGSLGFCQEEGIGIRWPGPDGTEFLGSGGIYFRFSTPNGIRQVGPGNLQATVAEDELYEGCNRGKRYPDRLRDDDGDGFVDEDPFDGVDNDRDGFVDEDFAAVGDEMRVTVATDRQTGLLQRQSSFAWTYGHVRDFVGFATCIVYPEGSAGVLRDFQAAIYADFRIGDRIDPSRGENDRYFIIETPRDPMPLRIPVAADENRYVALVVLGAEGPGNKRLGARAAILAATDSLWIAADGNARGEEPSRFVDVLPRDGWSFSSGRAGSAPASNGDFSALHERVGDVAMACIAETVPELRPGDEIRIDWAIVFGRSMGAIVKNAGRAIDTYEGVLDSEGRRHRWVVPARRAARVELEACPAFVWSYGQRQPAAAIALPPLLGDEEVEWLRGLNVPAIQYQQVDGKVLVTTDGPLVVETVLVEGQLTDGTLFTASIKRETLLGTQEDGAPDGNLAEDSIHLYPNPFLTDLNIILRIYDVALAEEAGGPSSVRIYDVRGRLVRTILQQDALHPGEYTHTWDGLDEFGKETAPGVYYVKLQIGDRSVTKRVILLR